MSKCGIRQEVAEQRGVLTFPWFFQDDDDDDEDTEDNEEEEDQEFGDDVSWFE